MDLNSGRQLPEDYFRVPSPARLWNYWMGGKDHYPVDREAGDAVAQVYPDIVTMAVQSRQFLVRVVRFLTIEAGVRQFLDIGAGLPTMQNTHEVAQSIIPSARVVYVDNDLVVLAHARALLTALSPEGVTDYVDSDYHHTEHVLAETRRVLDFTEPVAVMFMGVLGYVARAEEMRDLVSRMLEPMPSGSYLALWDGTETGAAVSEGAEVLAESDAAPYYLRGLDDLRGCFDGLELVDPGLVPITKWRPDPIEVGSGPPHIDAYGAVARK